MEKYIPDHVDPYRLAEQGIQLLDQRVKIDDLSRLKVLVLPDDTKISVDLHFGVDEQGLTNLKGKVATKLKLQCQRCMEPFIYEIISNFALGIVNTLDEANELPDQYEPALVSEGALPLKDLIEDEILLNLPIIPRHTPEECKVKLPYRAAGGEITQEEKSPFHVLASLKGSKDKRQ